MEKTKLLKAEGCLRLFSLLLAITSACLVGLDTQTKQVFLSIERKATYNDLPALKIMVIVQAVVAGYHLIQVCRCMIVISVLEQNPSLCHKNVAWLCFILDQSVAYVSWAATLAATQASSFAIAGVAHFQWMKLCNIYTRFCEQIGGGLICGFGATLLTAAVALISAFHLFRRYSPKQFLTLKSS